MRDTPHFHIPTGVIVIVYDFQSRTLCVNTYAALGASTTTNDDDLTLG